MLAICSAAPARVQFTQPDMFVDITHLSRGCAPPPQLSAIAPNLKALAAQVAEKHGIRVRDLIGQSRKRIYVRPRQEFMYLARTIFRSDGSFRYSTTMIGRFLDGRDHTTVVHGVRRHAQRARLAKIAEVRAANDASALIHGAAE